MYCSSEHVFVVLVNPTFPWKTSWNKRKTALSEFLHFILKPTEHCIQTGVIYAVADLGEEPPLILGKKSRNHRRKKDKQNKTTPPPL